jgi:ferrous iron transport protein B
VTAGTLRLALVGAPNSGKTTLFNGLTGGLAKTANYAGTTSPSKRSAASAEIRRRMR